MGLYQRCLSSAVVEYLQKQTQVKMRRCVYSAQVVIWLMIRQRLQAQGTLASAVEALSEGAADSFAEPSGAPPAAADFAAHGWIQPRAPAVAEATL
jgi:hypothetical protein